MRDTRPYVAESRDLTQLAPGLQTKGAAVLAEMQAKGHDAYIFEAVRIAERQWWIFGCGRTVAECTDRGVPAEYAWPTGGKVTNAPSHLASAHGHGLAIDIISRSKRWAMSPQFEADLGAAYRRQGMTWGGGWQSPHDTPHGQIALRRGGIIYAGPSASDRTRTAELGMAATWAVYGADIAPDTQHRIAA